MKKLYRYEYPRPAVTVDAVVFGFGPEGLQLLLIERALEPFRGSWALPGGFVEMDETLEQAARRELEEEAGVTKVYLEQLETFGDPGRDPRTRVISVAWYALVRMEDHNPIADSDAAQAAWHRVDALPPLAFDHAGIVQVALGRLRQKVRHEPIGFELLPSEFTLSQMQSLYEAILGRELDKRNFRRKLLAMNIVQELDKTERNVTHRPARLYRFDRRRYKAAQKRGFNFDL